MTMTCSIKKDISEISKMEDIEKIKRKEMTLRLPEDLFTVLKDFKKATSMSYTAQIINAIIWFYFSRGLLDLGWIKTKNAKNGKEKKEEININPLPEGVKFCDGDRCEMPASHLLKSC